jgi:TetR/AcrR family transcriptional regulator, lmrAB and yxaGH operons repressor
MATDTRTRMISTTARLIQARGLHGVSLSDILEESSAPRGSLYFHFPGGKTDLVLEAIQAGVEEASRVLRDCLESADNPAEGVRDFFQAAAREMGDSGYAFGCPVAPIVLDTPDEHSALARTCKASFEEWKAMYRDALVAGGLTPARASSLARTIISSLEGALILARSERDTTTITQVGNEMAEMIENAMRP